jgi:hypothetical protein
LNELNLSQRAVRSERLLREAQELTAARITVPLMEQAIPRLLADPSLRMWLIEPAMSARLSRWPIVNVIQTVLSPLITLVRKNLGPASAPEGQTVVSLAAHVVAAPICDRPTPPLRRCTRIGICGSRPPLSSAQVTCRDESSRRCSGSARRLCRQFLESFRCSWHRCAGCSRSARCSGFR